MQDVVDNDDFSLSNEFKVSFVNDIVNGLAYLHDTANICHGLLNLHSCVVTPQWTVRLSSYGLADLIHRGKIKKLMQIPLRTVHGVFNFCLIKRVSQNYCMLRPNC